MEEMINLQQKHYDEIKKAIDTIEVTAKLLGFETEKTQYTLYIKNQNKEITSILHSPIGNNALIIRFPNWNLTLEGETHETKLNYLKKILHNM